VNNKHRGSDYLYVGRSHKLRSRIRQHLGSNYKGTYALHMQRWAENFDEKIEIQYFKLVDQDNLLVQSVEDSLWQKLRPAFGRKGDK
jgi:NurA-like 5'-3' nuclease